MDNVCESCGLPLDDQRTSKIDPRYCVFCQNQDTGKLATKEEVKEGSIMAAMEIMGMGREEAEAVADKKMPKLPRWKDE